MIYISNSKWRKRGGRTYYHHLLADSVEELHEFARKVDVNRCWYSTKPVPHYDVNETLFDKCLSAGAVPASWVMEGKMVRKIKNGG